MGCLFVILLLFGIGFIYNILTKIGFTEIISGVITLLFFFGLMFAPTIMDIKKKRQTKLEQEDNIIAERELKKTLLERYNLPIDCPSYQYLSGYNNILNKTKVNVWINDNNLNFLASGDDIQKYQIPLSDIKFYSVKGDVRQEIEAKGGDATVGETMVAEGLLGTAVAMKKNQVIQDTKIIDERKTIINATIEGENKFVFFEGAELYNYLLENIPEKEQSFVAMNK